MCRKRECTHRRRALSHGGGTEISICVGRPTESISKLHKAGPWPSSLRSVLILLPLRLFPFVRFLFLALFLILLTAFVSHCVILSDWQSSFRVNLHRRRHIVAVWSRDVQSSQPFSRTP